MALKTEEAYNWNKKSASQQDIAVLIKYVLHFTGLINKSNSFYT